MAGRGAGCRHRGESAVQQIISSIMQFLQQGIAAIFKFLELIWTWSFGEIIAIFQSDWKTLPVWKLVVLVAVVAAVAYTLYKAVMVAYQQANNADKMLAMSRKVLTFDPDDPEALLGVSRVLAERTHDTDLDKDQRLAEAKKDAQRALETVDTDVPTAGVAPEKLAQYKGYVRSEAYEILGTIDFNAKAWANAEDNLKKSIDAFPQQPDAVAVFRLSVALDMQNKYPDALKYADQAVDLTKPGTNAGDAARKEKDRLVQLIGGISEPPAK